MNIEDLRQRFMGHQTNFEQDKIMMTIRQKGFELADFVNQTVPESREKSLAITHLEDAVMWANKAVARYGVQEKASGPGSLGS
jgi:hypothetical protein